MWGMGRVDIPCLREGYKARKNCLSINKTKAKVFLLFQGETNTLPEAFKKDGEIQTLVCRLTKHFYSYFVSFQKVRK